MTITALETRNEYTATAGQTVFTYTFKIFEDTDINVYVTPSGQDADDTADAVTPSVVTGVGDENGGTVTIVATTLGDKVTLVSDIAEKRETDYQNNGDYRASVVNDDFDRVVSLVKQVSDTFGRTLVFQESEQDAAGLTLSQPDALKLLQWNAGETGLQNYEIATEPLITNHVNTIADLRVLSLGDFTSGDNVIVNGYYAVGDGGGGPIRYLSTGQAPGTYTDNGGSIIVPTGGDGSAAWLWRDPQVLNIKWYGAYGDGSTDDSDFLVNAIESAANNTVLIPPGYTYMIDPDDYYAEMTIPDNVTVIAYGAVLLQAATYYYYSFESSTGNNFTWIGGKFLGVNPSESGGFRMLNGNKDYITFRDVVFENMLIGVEFIDGHNSILFDNCRFKDVDQALRFQFATNDGKGLSIKNCYFSGDHDNFIWIRSGNKSAVTIQDNVFDGSTGGAGNSVYISNNNADTTCGPFSVKGNYFNGGVASQTYLFFDDEEGGSGTYAFKGVDIRGNIFKGANPNGVWLQNANSIVIETNTFEMTDGNGVPVRIESTCDSSDLGQNEYDTGFPVVLQGETFKIFPYFRKKLYTVPSYYNQTFSTGSATINMETESGANWPDFSYPKGYYLNIQAKDSASSTTPGAYVRIGGIINEFMLHCQIGGVPNGQIVGASGYVEAKAGASASLDIDIVASGAGTVTLWLSVVAMEM